MSPAVCITSVSHQHKKWVSGVAGREKGALGEGEEGALSGKCVGASQEPASVREAASCRSNCAQGSPQPLIRRLEKELCSACGELGGY